MRLLSLAQLRLTRPATYERLDQRFREQSDPWGFERSPYEGERFEKMLALLGSIPHERVLEAGCAEGHFTQRLVTLSPDVTAIDVSAEAIRRARARAPQARYLHVKLEELPAPRRPYDVIVCGEMLYYLPDLSGLLPRLRRIGRYLLTSTSYHSALRVHAQLSDCRLLQRTVLASLRELKAGSIRLWEL